MSITCKETVYSWGKPGIQFLETKDVLYYVSVEWWIFWNTMYYALNGERSSVVSKSAPMLIRVSPHQQASYQYNQVFYSALSSELPGQIGILTVVFFFALDSSQR